MCFALIYTFQVPNMQKESGKCASFVQELRMPAYERVQDGWQHPQVRRRRRCL